MFPRRSKFGAIKTVVEGVSFSSKAEAERFRILKDAERFGKIYQLELQPRFELQPKFSLKGENIRAIEYVADFRYIVFDGPKMTHIVEDVKGMLLPEFKLKLKIWKRIYGTDYDFRIVKGMKAIRTPPA